MARTKKSPEELLDKYSYGKKAKSNMETSIRHTQEAKGVSELDTDENDDSVATDENEISQTPTPKRNIPKNDGLADILGGSPIKREYTGGALQGKHPIDIESVPEPAFDIPSIVPEDESFSGAPKQDPESGGSSNGPSGPSKQKQEPSHFRNEALDDVAGAERKKAAKSLTETFIQSYCMINDYAKKYVKFDPEEAQIKAIKGEFDMEVLSLPLQMPDGQTGSMGEFLMEMNKAADETFVVTEEFKAEVRPLLTEILAKKGWGMTTEQRLAYAVGKDAIPKAMAIFQMKKSMNYILEVSMQTLSEMKKQGMSNNFIINQQPEQPSYAKVENVKQPSNEQFDPEMVNKISDLPEQEIVLNSSKTKTKDNFQSAEIIEKPEVKSSVPLEIKETEEKEASE